MTELAEPTSLPPMNITGTEVLQPSQRRAHSICCPRAGLSSYSAGLTPARRTTAWLHGTCSTSHCWISPPPSATPASPPDPSFIIKKKKRKRKWWFQTKFLIRCFSIHVYLWYFDIVVHGQVRVISPTVYVCNGRIKWDHDLSRDPVGSLHQSYCNFTSSWRSYFGERFLEMWFHLTLGGQQSPWILACITCMV